MLGILTSLLLISCNASSVDEDGDGFPVGEDCDDRDPSVGRAVLVYDDFDGDGFGAGPATETCFPGADQARSDGDCDDQSREVHPGAVEVCDGLDDDCDEVLDEGVDVQVWFVDADGDGFGDPDQGVHSCDGGGLVSNSMDCDDTASTVYPGADEWCNDSDDDCDSAVDEGAQDEILSYTDIDGDTWGDGDPTWSCEIPTGSAGRDGDCDDTDWSVNPGVIEVCGNGVDDDCDATANGCRLEGAYSLTTHDARLRSSEAGSSLGYAVDGGGDVDGDGFDDVVLGAPDWYSSLGAVYVVSGNQTGELAVDSHAVELLGYDYAGAAGRDVAIVPDMDGDGDAEVAIAAPNADGDGVNDGEIYLFLGPISGSGSMLEADAVLSGEYFGGAGHALEGSGDLDGDGSGDLLVAAPWTRNSTGANGRTYLVSGDPGEDLELEDVDTIVEGDGVGWAMAGQVDFNGDGASDVALKGGGLGGEVALMFGPLASGILPVSGADAFLRGEKADDGAGLALAAGDVDGDGYGDLLVGAPNESSVDRYTGAVYVVLGPHSGSTSLAMADAKITGVALGDQLGQSLAVAGDVDGDGADDLLLGVHMVSEVVLFYGTPSGTSTYAAADASFMGEQAGDRTGEGLSTAGDWNGDGFADLLIGATHHSGSAYYAGAAYVVLGGGL